MLAWLMLGGNFDVGMLGENFDVGGDFRFQIQRACSATTWDKITTIWLFVNLNNNITWDGIHNRNYVDFVQ